MSNKLAAVGWQGITLRVPEDWSLVGVSGDEKKGYFRVDSPIASALEVRWSAGQGGKAPDLMVKCREFLSQMEKSCKKSRKTFSSKIRPEKDAVGSVGFVWRADRLGQGRLTYCPDCDRVMIAQVVSPRDEDISHLSPEILDSIRDHREDGWTEWALYGLRFAVPPGYRIEKQTLMSGYISLRFRYGGRSIVVERWGLVSAMLGSGSMADWYRKDIKPDIKGYRIQIEDSAVKGHEGLKITGRRGGIREALKAAGRSLTLHPHPGLFTGYAWNCDDSNRLFSVRATHLRNEDIAEKVVETITCHSEARRLRD